MRDQDILRYARQLVLPAIGAGGQRRLMDAHVMIVGCGGLGCIAAPYLAGAGIGKISLVDAGKVELANLHRQWVYQSDQQGMAKTSCLGTHLQHLNPDLSVTCHQQLFDPSLLEGIDLVLDCTDNARARTLIARSCWEAGITLVSAAVVGMNGQATIFKPADDQPCRDCIFPEDDSGDDSCSALGVLGPVVGMLASIQATEAIRQITGMSGGLEGRLMMIEMADMDMRFIKLTKKKDCRFCGSH